MVFLYLNSRFEERFNLQDYSCIDTAFDFFKEDQLYFEIPQDISVGQITSSKSTALLFQKSFQGMAWKILGCMAGIARPHTSFSTEL